MGHMRFMNYFTTFKVFLQNRTLRMQQGRLRARTGKVSWQFVLEDRVTRFRDTVTKFDGAAIILVKLGVLVGSSPT